jgi:hypothetical protein
MDLCYSTNCSLIKDVLLEVFEHLDYEELVRCEAVCRQWREILLCGSVWKQWFQKQIALSPSWQETWKRRASDDDALETADYRAICRETYQYVKELKSNWCTGQAVQRNILLNLPPSHRACRFYFYDDWIVVETWDFDPHSREGTTYLNFFMKNSSHVTECITLPPKHRFCYIDRSFLICYKYAKIKIFDRKIGHFTSEINSDDDDDLYIHCGTLCNGLLGVLFKDQINKRYLLRVWSVENPSRIALMKQLPFNLWGSHFPVSITMDNQFIVVMGYMPEEPIRLPKFNNGPGVMPLVAHFISTRTLEVKGSLTVDAERAAYDKGLLFVLIHGRVRIYDVSSGTFYRDLHLQKNLHSVDGWFEVSVNSKYVAILYTDKSGWIKWKTMLKIYELDALKNAEAEPNNLLFTTIEDLGDFSMIMDESRIVICNRTFDETSKAVALVFDFSPPQSGGQQVFKIRQTSQKSTSFQNRQFLKRIWQLRSILGSVFISVFLFYICCFLF